MRIVRLPAGISKESQNAAVALGNFDGVHLGHQAIIRRTIETAAALKCSSAVLTFEPHPLTVINPDCDPLRLTSFRQKAELIAQYGIDILYVVHFTDMFMHIKAASFIKDILKETLHARHVITGENFVFGHKRSGDAALLADKSAAFHYGYTAMPFAGSGTNYYSSTAARKALKEGDIPKANEVLGHDFAIDGRVRKGEGRGTMIGVPTANIALKNYLRPRFGVYAVEVTLDAGKSWLPAIANIGKKPTFGPFRELMEVHLFDYKNDLYSKRITARLKKFVRDEQKFANVDALKTQITEDCNMVRKWFGK